MAALKVATEATAAAETVMPEPAVKPRSGAPAEPRRLPSLKAATEPVSRSEAPVEAAFGNLQTSRNTVYLYPEDLTKLRQLSGYASTEYGIRAIDSMIVRAAPSLLEPDVRLLDVLKETELLDRQRRSRV